MLHVRIASPPELTGGLCSVMVETVDASLAEPPQAPEPPRPARRGIGERIRHGELAGIVGVVSLTESRHVTRGRP